MTYMLDTNVCIDAIRGKRAEVAAAVAEHFEEGIEVSSIVYAELMHGVEKSSDPARNAMALALLLSAMEIQDFDGGAAAEYGSIKAELERHGEAIGAMDTLIAAHAKTRGATLVTNNTREFQRVSGLEIENWAK